jgi:16S rRNA (cytosine1402-N4)-methyltransferase
MASAYSHHPVLLAESLAHLDLQPHSVVVDGTVGGGGHAAAILERTAPDGILIALDRDADALEAAGRTLEPFGARVHLIHASFRYLTRVLEQLGHPGVDGVLLDLGVSSPQLDRAERGFRFGGEQAAATPLDMRMDRRDPHTAADLLVRLSEAELAHCFREYGELPGAHRLARAIVEARDRGQAPRSAADLLALVAEARVGRGRRHHPATLVFQALRIAVNDEIAALDEGLEAAIEALNPGRRLVVIAYHSLEDRLVKNRLRDAERGCTCPPGTPLCICGGQKRLRVLTRRPVRPGPDELRTNPRARSARLRAAERLPRKAAQPPRSEPRASEVGRKTAQPKAAEAA